MKTCLGHPLENTDHLGLKALPGRTKYGNIKSMTDAKALAEEERRVRQLQRTVDLALFFLKKAPIEHAEAEKIVALVRKKALDLFPDKGQAFDLIYQPRFNRLLAERFGMH